MPPLISSYTRKAKSKLAPELTEGRPAQDFSAAALTSYILNLKKVIKYIINLYILIN
jgi:hypothetical protein